MKVAFPLFSEKELAIDFAHAQTICIYDDTNHALELIPISRIEKESGIINFFDVMVSNGLQSVVSPYYSYMALRVFRENNIETFKAKGKDLAKNINFFKTKGLTPFDIYESLFVGECAKSCSSCGTSCSEN